MINPYLKDMRDLNKGLSTNIHKFVGRLLVKIQSFNKTVQREDITSLLLAAYERLT